MSNRLRASLSKRGRVLRPRSSSLPPAAPEEHENADTFTSEEPVIAASEPKLIEPMVAAPEPVIPAPEPVIETPAPPPVVELPRVEAKVEAPVAAMPVAPQSVAPPGGKKKKKKKHHSDRPPVSAAPQAAPVPAKAATPAAVPAPQSAPAPASAKPVLFTAAGKPADENVDLSISHKFFTDGDSMPPPPVHEVEAFHEEKVVPPTQEALAHRARLKRIVGGVVAAAGLVALVGIGKALVTSKSADAMPTNAAAEARLPETKKAETAAPKAPAAAIPDTKAADKKDDAKAVETAAPSASADAAKPDDSAKPDDKKADDKKDDAAKLAPAEIKDLKTKAAITANGGDMTKAIDAAKAAIAADPTDAMSYMYLYSDYSNIGKGKDASETLNDCVRNATSPDKWQCSQWGGHK